MRRFSMKTVFTYTHVKWFYGQSECAYYLNYFIKPAKLQFKMYITLFYMRGQRPLFIVRFIVTILASKLNPHFFEISTGSKIIGTRT